VRTYKAFWICELNGGSRKKRYDTTPVLIRDAGHAVRLCRWQGRMLHVARNEYKRPRDAKETKTQRRNIKDVLITRPINDKLR
ncbi:hypothetical protein GWI33_021545, partial [Rhynchophorus ferrugineus]